jgi:hypothetical protein
VVSVVGRGPGFAVWPYGHGKAVVLDQFAHRGKCRSITHGDMTAHRDIARGHLEVCRHFHHEVSATSYDVVGAVQDRELVYAVPRAHNLDARPRAPHLLDPPRGRESCLPAWQRRASPARRRIAQAERGRFGSLGALKVPSKRRSCDAPYLMPIGVCSVDGPRSQGDPGPRRA